MRKLVSAVSLVVLASLSACASSTPQRQVAWAPRGYADNTFVPDVSRCDIPACTPKPAVIPEQPRPAGAW